MKNTSLNSGGNLEELKANLAQQQEKLDALTDEHSSNKTRFETAFTDVDGELSANSEEQNSIGMDVLDASASKENASAKLDSAKANELTATDNLKTNENSLSGAEKNVTSAEATVQSAQTVQDVAQNSYDVATSCADAAKNDFNAKQSSLSSAKASASEAQSKKSIWDKLTDAVKSTINAIFKALDVAIAAFNKAKENLTKAINAQTEKRNALEDATGISEEAKTQLEERKSEKDEAQELVEAAKIVLEAATGSREVSQEELDKALATVEAAKQKQEKAQAKGMELSSKKSALEQECTSLLSQLEASIGDKKITVEELKNQISEAQAQALAEQVSSTQNSVNEETENIYMLEQMSAELGMKGSEYKANRESAGLGGLVAASFGFGYQKEGEQWFNNRTMIEKAIASGDPDKIKEAYKSLYADKEVPSAFDAKGECIRTTKLAKMSDAELENFIKQEKSDATEAAIVVSQMTDKQKEEISNILLMQGQKLSTQAHSASSDQGILSYGLGKVNCLLDIGMSEVQMESQADAYYEKIKALDPSSPDFAAQYKAITGNNLNLNELLSYADKTSLSAAKENYNSKGSFDVSLLDIKQEKSSKTKSRISNSKASESIMDYKNTQETMTNAVIGTAAAVIAVAGVALTPFTGGASLALTAVATGALTTGLKALNGIQANGDEYDYSAKEGLKDFTIGTITGFSGGAANALAGSVIKGAGGSIVKQLAVNAAKEGFEGTLDGLISSAGCYMADVGTGEKDFELKDFISQTAQGALFGGLTGVALSPIGFGIDKIRNKTSVSELGRKLSDLDIDEKVHVTDAEKKMAEIGNKELYSDSALSAIDDETLAKIKKLENYGVSVGDLMLGSTNFNKSNWASGAGSLNKNITDDIDKLYKAYSSLEFSDIVTEADFFARQSAIKNAKKDTFTPLITSKTELNGLKVGDVYRTLEKDGSEVLKIAVASKDGLSSANLNMSAETYLELFPPVTRFANAQGSVGDCYLITGLNGMYSNNTTRASVLKSFTENADGSIDVQVGNVKHTLIFDGSFGNDLTWDSTTISNAASGMKALETGYGMNLVNDKLTEYTEGSWRNKVMSYANSIESLENNLKRYTKKEDIDRMKTAIKWYEDEIDKLNNEYTKYVKNGNEILSNPKENEGLRNLGGRTSDVYQAFGIESGSSAYNDNAFDSLTDLAKKGDIVLSVGTKGTSDKKFLDEGLNIAGKHAYTLDIENGKYYLTNPWFSAVKIEVPREKIGKYVNTIYYGYMS